MAQSSRMRDAADRARAPRWERRADDRPGEILDAALAVLAERGYARCRVDEVARRAGVSKGTVYVYFPAKIDLIRALVAQAPDNLDDRLDDVETADSADERLRRLLEAIWDVVSDPHVDTIYRIVVAEPAELGEMAVQYVAALTERSIGVIAQAISDGVAEGSFRRCDPIEAARMIVGLVFQHVAWSKDPALIGRIGLGDGQGALDGIEAFYRAALSVRET